MDRNKGFITRFIKKQNKKLYRTHQRIRIARSIKDIRQAPNITATAKIDSLQSLRQIARNYPKL